LWLDQPLAGRLPGVPALRASAALAPRCCVHIYDFSHLRTLLPLTRTNLERRAGRHAIVPAALNHAHVQERIAGSVAELDKAKSFIRVYHFTVARIGGLERLSN
jgi:hypothetical protein